MKLFEMKGWPILPSMFLAACVSTSSTDWTGTPELMLEFPANSARCEMFSEGTVPMPASTPTGPNFTVTSNYGTSYQVTANNSLQAGMTELGAAIGYREQVSRRYEQCMTILGYRYQGT